MAAGADRTVSADRRVRPPEGGRAAGGLDSETALAIYRRLDRRFGPQGWWPAETPFEVIVGAILTQNTAWKNVERAIANLKAKRLLTVSALNAVPEGELAVLIRPSGYFNQKAKRLKRMAAFIVDRFAGSLDRMFSGDPGRLRETLLAVNGLGPETVDSILLYAGNLPVFVVDAYTRRIFSRHGLIGAEASYDAIQAAFMRALPHDAALFNAYHALIVRTAKVYCKKDPDCAACPLRTLPGFTAPK